MPDSNDTRDEAFTAAYLALAVAGLFTLGTLLNAGPTLVFTLRKMSARPRRQRGWRGDCRSPQDQRPPERASLPDRGPVARGIRGGVVRVQHDGNNGCYVEAYVEFDDPLGGIVNVGLAFADQDVLHLITNGVRLVLATRPMPSRCSAAADSMAHLKAPTSLATGLWAEPTTSGASWSPRQRSCGTATRCTTWPVGRPASGLSGMSADTS